MTEKDLNNKDAKWVLTMMAIGESESQEQQDRLDQMKNKKPKR